MATASIRQTKDNSQTPLQHDAGQAQVQWALFIVTTPTHYANATPETDGVDCGASRKRQ